MTSAFKAAYGRTPGGTTYTKDFHQPRSGQARALERAFDLPEGGETQVTWKWPGGEDLNGRFKQATDYDLVSGGRMNLRWSTGSAPMPWRLTDHPTELTLQTLQGVPDSTSEAVANAQFDSIKASAERPWFVAVHLQGDGPVLHARVVLENPQSGRTFASTSSLPKVIQDAMSRVPTSVTGGYIEFQREAPVREEDCDSDFGGIGVQSQCPFSWPAGYWQDCCAGGLNSHDRRESGGADV